jgi:hypothetical protein
MLAARRRISGNARGCEPATRIYFRLACCPALGSFAFSSEAGPSPSKLPA